MSESKNSPNGVFAVSAGTEIFQYIGRMDQDSFDRMMAWATLNRASDVTVQPGNHVMAEIAGQWRRITKMALNLPEVQGIIRAIYNDSGPAAISTGKDLDFAYELRNPMKSTSTGQWEVGYELQPSKLRFRVNITGGRNPGGGDGASLTLRSLPSQPIEISKLNVEPPIMKFWRPDQGLNLVCGPTGSGKSTLLSSLVRWRCEQENANEKIIEFSSPIEYVYDDLLFPSSFVWQTGAGQHLINHEERSEGGIWSHCIRNALRRKPSTIILGEARDRHTIEGCVQASLSGHLTISTLHTIGVPETFRRLVMPFPGPERATISVDLLQVLNLVVTQILVKKVGGGKQAIREYMLFDTNVKRALEEVSPDEWPRIIRKMLSTGFTSQGKPVIGQAMDKAARILFEQNMISEEIMHEASVRAAVEEGVAGWQNT